MRPEEQRAAILEFISNEASASRQGVISMLWEYGDVAPPTVHNRLKELEEQGKIIFDVDPLSGAKSYRLTEAGAAYLLIKDGKVHVRYRKTDGEEVLVHDDHIEAHDALGETVKEPQTGSDTFRDSVAIMLERNQKLWTEAEVIAMKFDIEAKTINATLAADDRFECRWTKHPKTQANVCLWALKSRLERPEPQPEPEQSKVVYARFPQTPPPPATVTDAASVDAALGVVATAVSDHRKLVQRVAELEAENAVLALRLERAAHALAGVEQ
jgi:DNA-binding PadR family transcriptional regulator